ncbi:MAG: glycosyltransferase family 25 protein [Planctomycetales bacterium]|nr:glycosyltransferase family 25 protein [Planctomycetales bacterium]
MNDHAFVISLARSTTRAANALSILDQLPMTGEVLPAVDGRALSEDEIATVFQRQIHSPRYPFELKANEIGCFLSHRKAWQQIVERGLDAAMILEDDVAVDSQTIASAVDYLRSLQSQFPYVQFPVRPVPKSAAVLTTSIDHSIRLPQVTMLRTSGQWVTRDAAAELLKATKKFDRPVDTTLQMHWITSVRPVVLEPSCIVDACNDLGGSTIGEGKKRTLNLTKIRREIDRTLYRTRIARLSAIYRSMAG